LFGQVSAFAALNEKNERRLSENDGRRFLAILIMI